MCVDDLVCVGAEPLFMLDYIATGKVDPERIATVVGGVHEGCRQAGCALIGGETAEHAGVMAPDELDLAGFAVGAVEDGTQLGPERVAAGDAVIGLPSPGLRSNGYTLARHVLLERAGLDLGDPAWDGADVDGGRRAAAAVGRSTPRPCWPHAPPPVTHSMRARTSPVAASWATCPGRCPRASALCLRRSAWEEPRIFEEIRRLGAVDEDEMDRVFNRGIGMALVVGSEGSTACSRRWPRRACPAPSSVRSWPGRACGSHERRRARTPSSAPTCSSTR